MMYQVSIPATFSLVRPIFYFSYLSSVNLETNILFKANDISRQIFEKSSNTKFHENPSSGSRVVPCEQANRQTDGQPSGS